MSKGRGTTLAAFVSGLIVGPVLVTAATKCSVGPEVPQSPGPTEGVEALGSCLLGAQALNSSVEVWRRRLGELSCARSKDRAACEKQAKGTADTLTVPVGDALREARDAQRMLWMTHQHTGFCAAASDPACGYAVGELETRSRRAVETVRVFKDRAESLSAAK